MSEATIEIFGEQIYSPAQDEYRGRTVGKWAGYIVADVEITVGRHGVKSSIKADHLEFDRLRPYEFEIMSNVCCLTFIVVKSYQLTEDGKIHLSEATKRSVRVETLVLPKSLKVTTDWGEPKE